MSIFVEMRFKHELACWRPCDYSSQVRALRAQGLSAEAAAPKVDMTKFSADFPSIRAVGVDAAGVRRIYKLAQEPEPAN